MDATTYEITFEGTLPPGAEIEFGDLELSVGPRRSVLRGKLPDQAALHGVLARLDALGLSLVEVVRR